MRFSRTLRFLSRWSVAVYRYRTNRFSYSTLSSQLLENRTLFWGSVPWHYGIVVVFAHLIGFFIPGMWANLTSNAGTLYTVELIGFTFGLAALVGTVRADLPPLHNKERILAVTSPMDGVLLLSLLVQVGARLLCFAGLPLGRLTGMSTRPCRGLFRW